ncbi:hypothetical protein ANO14919_022760 [Xylariales sp. No.14919]|nr:hypothetical protein ANO14919_022760 [Xylariales sp. No.14919]
MDHVNRSRFWKADQLNKDHLKLEIQKINICAYLNPTCRPKCLPSNHWVMFLQYSDTSSIKVDMHPGQLGGTIDVSSKTYTNSNRAVHIFSLEPMGEFTGQDILDLIAENRLHQYDFNEDNEGCRFWIFTILEFLEWDGFLPVGTAKSSRDALSYLYTKPGESMPREIQYGTFY